MKKMNLYERMRLWLRARRYLKKSERDEVHFACNTMQSGQNVLDIGANKGAYTYWMSTIVGPSGAVYAFEPQPALVDYLGRYANSCRHQNLHVCPVALSDRKGRGRLLLPEHCGWARLVTEVQNGDSVIDVSVEILDDYLDSVEANRPIAFLKCDVEGHETAVFRGATRLLTMDRPVLLFESAPLMHVPKNGHPPFEFLKALGYEGYFFCDSELVPIECYSSAEHVLTNQVIQNYVFLHPTTASLVKDRFPYRVQHNPAISILRRAA